MADAADWERGWANQATTHKTAYVEMRDDKFTTTEHLNMTKKKLWIA